MNIAFISYEYPAETAVGGIATYVYQASQVMLSRGHYVEIFAGSPSHSSSLVQEGILVHRVLEVDRTKFYQSIADKFSERHQKICFDVIEGPDIFAESLGAASRHPEIPLVVKIHMPSFLVDNINVGHRQLPLKPKAFLKTIRKRQNPFKDSRRRLYDLEKNHALKADEVIVLTKDMIPKVIKPWGINMDKVSILPNPYIPSVSLLDIPVETEIKTVSYLGRLEIRKGVVYLAKAIPQVIEEFPNTKFRFVGRSVQSPDPQMGMREYIEKLLESYLNSVEFIDQVPPEEIPKILAKTDICVFPSLWENFPNVCLEAMAAGRGIVGSNAGGMCEMLENGKAGILVPPKNPLAISNAIKELLRDPRKRFAFGQEARRHLLSSYGSEQVGTLMEAIYRRAIRRKKILAKHKNSC